MGYVNAIAPGAHLAVLWMAQGDDVRLVVLNEPPLAEHQFIERFQVALAQVGALKYGKTRE
jgi:hypothetical protein